MPAAAASREWKIPTTVFIIPSRAFRFCITRASEADIAHIV
jgi:hypothetical protein